MVVRVDFNVPLSKVGKRTITDETRIVKALPTINVCYFGFLCNV